MKLFKFHLINKLNNVYLSRVIGKLTLKSPCLVMCVRRGILSKTAFFMSLASVACEYKGRYGGCTRAGGCLLLTTPVMYLLGRQH